MNSQAEPAQKQQVSREAAPDLSLVVALYYEEECVEEYVRRVREQLDKEPLHYEIVFVDDGSQDRTISIVTQMSREDPRIKLVELARNHGKEAAISAGIEHATGRYLMMMDVDLQDPPDFILTFYHRAVEGNYDLIFGVREAKSDRFFNVIFSKLFWSFLNFLTGLEIPKNLAVMRIFSRKFADAFLLFPERVRFIEGVFMLVGMRRTTLVIPNHERFAGVSKFNFRRKMKLAINAVLAFSQRPLVLATGTGVGLLLCSFLYAGYAFVRKLVYDIGLQGWTSSFIAIIGIGGIQLILMGIIGSYVGRIYTEVKRRPIYTVQERHNLETPRKRIHP